jgi:hypothetical protein
MQRGAMLAVQEAKALTIEHEPGALTQFKPEETRSDLSKIEVLAAYGAKLRDDTKLYDLAVKKLEVVVDLVDWIDRHVQLPGAQKKRDNHVTALMSYAEILTTLGYAPASTQLINTWRKLSKLAREDTDTAVEKLVNGWKMRAGMLAPPDPKPKKENEDRDLAVEAIFRAYTKLDPDQRIELKQKIMAFEKSYKDPFKDVKEW